MGGGGAEALAGKIDLVSTATISAENMVPFTGNEDEEAQSAGDE